MVPATVIVSGLAIEVRFPATEIAVITPMNHFSWQEDQSMKTKKSCMRRLFRLVATLPVLFLTVGLALPALAAPPPPIPAGDVRIHYYRPDGNFSGWTMWTWNASTENQTSWCSTELNQAGTDSYGAYWDVSVNTAWGNPTGDHPCPRQHFL